MLGGKTYCSPPLEMEPSPAQNPGIGPRLDWPSVTVGSMKARRYCEQSCTCQHVSTGCCSFCCRVPWLLGRFEGKSWNLKKIQGLTSPCFISFLGGSCNLSILFPWKAGAPPGSPGASSKKKPEGPRRARTKDAMSSAKRGVLPMPGKSREPLKWRLPLGWRVSCSNPFPTCAGETITIEWDWSFFGDGVDPGLVNLNTCNRLNPKPDSKPLYWRSHLFLAIQIRDLNRSRLNWNDPDIGCIPIMFRIPKLGTDLHRPSQPPPPALGCQSAKIEGQDVELQRRIVAPKAWGCVEVGAQDARLAPHGLNFDSMWICWGKNACTRLIALNYYYRFLLACHRPLSILHRTFEVWTLVNMPSQRPSPPKGLW